MTVQAKAGVPHVGQNEWARFVPLSAVLMYVLGLPLNRRKLSFGAGTDRRKAEPVSI